MNYITENNKLPSGRTSLAPEQMRKGGEYNFPVLENGRVAIYDAMVSRVSDEKVYLMKGKIQYGSCTGFELDAPETEFFDEEREIDRDHIGTLITEL